MSMDKLILASASPRRRELMARITEDFQVIPSGVDETVPDGIDALEQAEYLARIKALDICKKYPGITVIGSDTCVVAENEVLGKPKDKADALRMLELLSGKTHKVVTGCAICKDCRVTSFTNITEVEFYPLSKEEMEEYANTDEPYDKAGGYAIQGKAGLFVKSINGDYFNVVGFPISQLNKELIKFKNAEHL